LETVFSSNEAAGPFGSTLAGFTRSSSTGSRSGSRINALTEPQRCGLGGLNLSGASLFAAALADWFRFALIPAAALFS
jgi:hypothetical protein